MVRGGRTQELFSGERRRQGVSFEAHLSCKHNCDVPGPGGMPEGSTESSAGWRRGDTGDAGKNGGRVAAAGRAEQRVHGNSEVAAISDDTAAGERDADVDPGAQRRAREGRPGADDDRSAAAAGKSGFA